MEFIETTTFTKQVQEHLSDDEYKELQESLIINPAEGDLIKNSGGCRKIRWKQKNKGKSGGVRIIYYWKTRDNKIFPLYIYPKNKQENLTPKQLKLLKSTVKEI